ncbi:hypothetical protein MtrunA17_Chr5g0442441 [Medicago truncatula]|uniref:Uncharacterized protein n=1 Tax=Medicago truncatula TaxID=3880 RepID=G7K370_MEDTR|nr:GATA zinc finger domain-containing protein 14 [Medicago truncatula]AET00295.1 hypothetical protein MTR_5g090510 [Medicago truncatula]RHN57621.1 hypothetical protein MtrunA17_Chr5g0442441 [Medicago truncatula]
MVNNFWAFRREIAENNDNNRPVEPDTQTRNNHQSENGYLTPPQTMLQRPQNYHLMGVDNSSTNGFTHHVPHYCQTHRNHQSTNGYLTTPQLERPQNHFMGVNNFNQECYQRNNSVDAATLPMRNFPFSANDTTSFITSSRYGRALPLGSGLTSSPQQHMSSPNTTLLPSYHANLAQNSSSNTVGSQGFSNWSRNSSRPMIRNQRNHRYLPYGEGSNRRNSSFLMNNSNLRPTGHTNRFHNVNDGSIPSATPPPCNDLNMILSSGNANWDSTCDTSTSHRVFDIRDNEAANRSTPPPFCPINRNDFNPHARVDTNRFHLNDGSIPITTPPVCPINTEDMSMFLSSGNDNLDSARETSTSHRVFEIRDTDVWRRPMTPPDNYFEAIQTEKKEQLLFKDTIPTSSVTEADDANANENDNEHLDLSLHL